MATQREESKQEWTGTATEGSIKTGCLQRIADATEKMASNYIQMENDLKRYKRWYEEEQKVSTRLLRKNIALRGVITKLKNKQNAKPF